MLFVINRKIANIFLNIKSKRVVERVLYTYHCMVTLCFADVNTFCFIHLASYISSFYHHYHPSSVNYLKVKMKQISNIFKIPDLLGVLEVHLVRAVRDLLSRRVIRYCLACPEVQVDPKTILI